MAPVIIVIVWILCTSCYSQTTLVGCFHSPGYCNQSKPGCFGNNECVQCDFPISFGGNGLPVCTLKNLSSLCHTQYPACSFTSSPTPAPTNIPTLSPLTNAPTKSPTICINGAPNLSKPYKTVRIFTVDNQCPYPLWIGMNGKSWISGTFEPGQIPYNGGFKLEPTQNINLSVPIMQAINIWARTNCANVEGSGFECDTGSCSNSDNLMGKDGQCCNTKPSGIYSCGSPQPPASLIELTLAKTECSDNDYYDVSLVDGYNIPVSVEPFNYVKTETINMQSLGNYACGTTNVNPFDSSSNCPNVMFVDGQSTRNKSDNYDFSQLKYCLSICKSVDTTSQRNKSKLLQDWYDISDSYSVLSEFYDDGKLSRRFIGSQFAAKKLLDLLCCQCGHNNKRGCYADMLSCNFGCTPFLPDSNDPKKKIWNGTIVSPTWNDTEENYYKRECTNYGYKTKLLGIHEHMPLWPLFDHNNVKINPAYIYNNTSPDAYSWQYNDQSSTFQCRNADYKFTFCHETLDFIELMESTNFPAIVPTGFDESSAYETGSYILLLYVIAVQCMQNWI